MSLCFTIMEVLFSYADDILKGVVLDLGSTYKPVQTRKVDGSVLALDWGGVWAHSSSMDGVIEL